MKCPWCDFSGSPRELHAHLGATHPETVRFEERAGKSFYAITCPVCGSGYDRQIKPRGRDPGFVEEFSAQIRLVAFDMLVNHLLVEHEESEVAGGTVAEPGPAPSGPGPPGAGPAWLVEARRRKADEGEGP